MKRRVVVAVLILGGLANAQTLTLTARPVMVSLTIPTPPTLTIPARAPTVNGLSTSVFRSSLTGSSSLTLAGSSSLTLTGSSSLIRTDSSSLTGSVGMPSTGTVAYPQSFPAASTRTEVPLELTVPTGDEGAIPGTFDVPTNVSSSQPSVADYSCATSRPDFRYQPGKLNFQPESTSHLGQVDMNFWTGLPPGTNRYVPLGEF